MENPEGNFEITKGNQLPDKSKETVEKWVDKKAQPFLNQFDKRVVNNKEYSLLERKYKLFKWLVIIIGIGIIGFLIFSWSGSFKTDVICESTVCPSLSCPDISCPDLKCPDINLSCGEITFPNNLNLNISNSS